MRLLSLFLIGLAATCSACAGPKPDASAPNAAENGRVRVKYRSAFAVPRLDTSRHESAAMEAERTILARMRSSGYDIVDHAPYDVRMELTVRVHDEDHADATAVFYDQKDRVVDRMTVATAPKKVGTSFVDEVRGSKKLKAKAKAKN